MTNPIARGTYDRSVGYNSEEFLRAFCWESNQRSMRVGWLRWLYVSRDSETGGITTKERLGADARDVWKILEGWYPDFMNWSAEKLDSEFRILRHIARMGTPQEWFDLRVLRMAKPRLGPPPHD